jgi:cell division protein FtsB
MGRERAPFIVAAIYHQATKERLTNLKAQNDELKAQNAELKTQLNRIESMLLKLTTT